MLERICDGVVVLFDYVIKDDVGVTLDASRSDEPGVYLHGAQNIAVGLEAALTGRRVGESLSVTVGPEEGFGAHDGRAPRTVSRDVFPPDTDLAPGMQCTSEGDGDDPWVLWVVGVTPDTVTLDTNHPLAGKRVTYDVTITALRAATSTELAAGAPEPA